jgi:hypothetical protein
MLGSDHNPLILDSGEERRRRRPRFFFEQGWLERPEFPALVATRWAALEVPGSREIDPISAWNRQSAGLRQFLKGWGANIGKENRDHKAATLARIMELDQLADTVGLDEEGWALRYHLEDELTQLAMVEEEY